MYCCSKASLPLTHPPGSSLAPAIRLSAPPPVCLSVNPPGPEVVEPLPIDRHGQLLLVLSACENKKSILFQLARLSSDSPIPLPRISGILAAVEEK